MHLDPAFPAMLRLSDAMLFMPAPIVSSCPTARCSVPVAPAVEAWPGCIAVHVTSAIMQFSCEVALFAGVIARRICMNGNDTVETAPGTIPSFCVVKLMLDSGTPRAGRSWYAFHGLKQPAPPGIAQSSVLRPLPPLAPVVVDRSPLVSSQPGMPILGVCEMA